MFKQAEGMARQRGTNERPATFRRPFLANEVWANYLRGETNHVPFNARYVYGTHRDFKWKWVPDDNDPQHRGSWERMAAGHRQMPVHGPVNWDSLWPDWQSVGDDFVQMGTADDPLSPEQRTALNEQMLNSDYIISSFTRQLKSGGYGSVWRVTCQKRELHGLPGIPGRQFWAACKVIRLRTELIDDDQDFVHSVNQMLADMHALRYIKHKNIVKYYETIAIPDTKTKFPYSTVLVLMELCDGDLEQVINLWGRPLPLDFCRKWMRDIALGVRYLHNNHNMTHLDIKPPNIMFQFSCHDSYRPSPDLANIIGQWETITFKLGDLGSCQSFTKKSAITTEYGGTVKWNAPEMKTLSPMNRVPTAAKPCDVYSLGATLASCLLSDTVYQKHQDKNTLYKHMYKIRKGVVVNRGISWQLAQLIAFMVHPTPSERPTINEVLLHNWLKPIAKRYEKRKRDDTEDVEELRRATKRRPI